MDTSRCSPWHHRCVTHLYRIPLFNFNYAIGSPFYLIQKTSVRSFFNYVLLFHFSIDYFGNTSTITRLYLDNVGIPLSVTFKIKCIVSGLSTTGAITEVLYIFSAKANLTGCL